MSNNNGIITKPVRMINDVATVLGTSENRLSQLCRHGNINMWSKYKPFRSSAFAFASDSEREAALRNANYGLQIPTASNASSMMQSFASISQSQIVWSYLKPQGGGYNQYYRLLDFDGYNHQARMPFNWELTSDNISESDPIKVSMNVIGEGYTISDLGSLSNATPYQGMLLRKQGQTSDIRAVTTSGGATWEINNHGLSYGTYDILFCFCSRQCQITDLLQQETFVPTPRPHRVLTIVSGTGITFNGSDVLRIGTKLSFTLNAVSSVQRSISQVAVYYVRNGGYNTQTNIITNTGLVVDSKDLASGNVPKSWFVNLDLGEYISSFQTAGRLILTYAYNGATYRFNLTNAISQIMPAL